jgi:uncharacterized protein (DUF1501 family)
MQRRSFVSSALSVAFLGGNASRRAGAGRRAHSRAALPAFDSPDNVLVVVQMAGGNDGLNTVVPYSDDDYHRVRPAIGIAGGKCSSSTAASDSIRRSRAQRTLSRRASSRSCKASAIPIPTARTSKRRRFGKRPHPTARSNTAGSGATSIALSAGAKPPSLFEAVSLGDTLPAALVASHVEVPAIGALGAFGYNTGPRSRIQAERRRALRRREGRAVAVSRDDRVDRARRLSRRRRAARETRPSPTRSRIRATVFRAQLALAAQMIGSSAGSKIVFVSIGSFDTHAGQRAQQDRLLGYLGDGLLAFYNGSCRAWARRQGADDDVQRVRPARHAERSRTAPITEPRCRCSSSAAASRAASTAIIRR